MIFSANKDLLKILVFMLLVCALSGCDRRVSKEKLSGIYVTKLNYGKGKLKLYPSGKCTLEFIYNKSNRTVKDSGTWKLENRESFPFKETRVLLSGIFTIGSNLGTPYYGLRPTDIWVVSSYVSDNTLHLGYGLDQRYFFTKVEEINGNINSNYTRKR